MNFSSLSTAPAVSQITATPRYRFHDRLYFLLEATLRAVRGSSIVQPTSYPTKLSKCSPSPLWPRFLCCPPNAQGSLDCATDCSAIFAAPTRVSLRVIPVLGSTFTGWSGDPDCSKGVVP